MTATADPYADDTAASVAARAALLGDRTRALICLRLLDGRAWTAGELAKAASVSAATASEHLDRLVRGGLLAEERQGRHRYVRLADPDAANLVEILAAGSPTPPAPSSYAAVRAAAELAAGRTCYDHLAGRLGVGLLDAFDHRGLLSRRDGIAITESGVAAFTSLGIDLNGLRASRRPLARLCLDWTERRSHLAGGLGAAINTALAERGWIRRGVGRAVEVTDDGRRSLQAEFGLRIR